MMNSMNSKENKELFIELFVKNSLKDPLSDSVKESVSDFVNKKKFKVKFAEAYYFHGVKNKKNFNRILESIFVDKITQGYKVNSYGFSGFEFLLKVFYLPGMTDNKALIAVQALKDNNIKINRNNVRSARHYYFNGLNEKQLKLIALKSLFNPVIESFKIINLKKKVIYNERIK